MAAIYFISLGCPKNRVDTEVMVGVAELHGYRNTNDPTQAEVIVVNTCGFIGAARRESIAAILEMAEHKQSGHCRRLVVTGCLAQAHAEELARELPEVDHFMGSSDMLKLATVLKGDAQRLLVGDPSSWIVDASTPRTLSSSSASAYVKIAEGCNRRCSFCIIPQLRGKQRSRPLEDVVDEVKRLVDQGVVEVNLVSQDTVAYGRDASEGAADLAQLVQRVADVAGLRWLRIFYLYPEALNEQLIDLLADHPTVLPYVDMPLQHAADAMLRRMRRGHDGRMIRRLVEQLRERVDALTFRAAFIVGHPGESKQEYEQLRELIEWARFEHVGLFRYSDEESSHSYSLPDKVSPLVTANRFRQLAAICRRIAREQNARLVGNRLEVLVEGVSDEHEAVEMGRHRGQAPEIDGQVYLTGTEQLAVLPRPGQLIEVEITQSSDFDLAAEVTRGPDVDIATRPAGRVSLTVIGADNRGLDP